MSDPKTSSVLVEHKKLNASTRWSYGLGCIGRDANYTLVVNFIMTYLTLAVGLSSRQLVAIMVIMIIARIWDAVNDPIMGVIIDNFKSPWGKFKPFILVGAVLNSFLTVLMFANPSQSEWLYVAVFGISYILWDITYTMNDIGYWSMLPSLTVNPKEREKLTSLARIGANLGLFLTTALVPLLTAGQMGKMYPIVAAGIAALFVACQILVVVGVKEDRNVITSADSSIKFKDMYKVLLGNDQLMVIVTAIFLFNIGYFVTTGFGIQFFYFDYGNYGGNEFTYFALVIGVSQILTLALHPLFSKKITRRQLFSLGIALVVAGYLGFMAVGYVLPMNMGALAVIGFVLFAGQAMIQLLNYILLADTVEYGQWKLGTRNESVIFSLNPFITKMASAVQVAVFSITMLVSGLNKFSDKISVVESDNSLTKEQVISKGNEIVSSIPSGSLLTMRISMIVFPLALIIICYVLYMKKYKIDEKMYDKIIHDLEIRGTENACKEVTQND